MNRSKTYMLPLALNTFKLKKELITNIENTYLFNESHSLEKCIGISFKLLKLKDRDILEEVEKLKEHSSFISIEQNKKEVLYIFEFPEKYYPEYFKFIKGRYSQFSRRTKEIILRFWTEFQTLDKSLIYDLIYLKQVLFKDEKLRKELEDDLDVKLPINAELESIMEHKLEMFIANKMKKSAVEA